MNNQYSMRIRNGKIKYLFGGRLSKRLRKISKKLMRSESKLLILKANSYECTN